MSIGQPTAEEIAQKFCVDLLCNALACAGCPVHEMQDNAALRASHAQLEGLTKELALASYDIAISGPIAKVKYFWEILKQLRDIANASVVSDTARKG